MRAAASAARRSANGSLLPDGTSPAANSPASVSRRSATPSTAPANERGEYSLSIAHEYLIPALEAARVVVAEVNQRAPWTYGERPVLEADPPGRERLRAAIAAHLAFGAEHADELSPLPVELRSRSPARRLEIIGRRDAYEAMWREAISAAIAEGALPGVDIRLTGIAILSACNWFTQWYRPDGPLGVDRIAREFGDIFMGPAG